MAGLPNTAPSLDEVQTSEAISRNVDLFTGNVTLAPKLYELPGPAESPALSFQLQLLYESNVARAAGLDNRAAPTSALGLGWTLPRDRIFMVAPDTASEEGALFFLDNGRQQLKLIRSQAPFSGQASDEAWEVETYAFWRIVRRRGAGQDAWIVVQDDGLIHTYGGAISPVPGTPYLASEGASIEWGVAFGGESGAWAGPGFATLGQRQFACAWNRRSVADRYGNQLLFDYNGFERNSAGLLPGVERLVGGPDGLPYTRSCYLTGVRGVDGRTLVFGYADKFPTTERPDLFEYFDPHADFPANDLPNPFQDRYETQYLADITVYGPARTGEPGTEGPIALVPIRRFELEYGEGPVCLIETADRGLIASSVKRLLRAITPLMPDGSRLPPWRFDYWTDPSAGGNVGALRSTLEPTGALESYLYGEIDLSSCSRSFTVSKPSTAGTDAVPRVWFGPDYAVTTWLDAFGTLWLEVYRWIGAWKLSFSDQRTLPSDLPRNLTVSCADTFAVVSLSAPTAPLAGILVLSEDRRRLWTWNRTLSGSDGGFLEIPAGPSFGLLVAEGYFLALGQATALAPLVANRYTWQWQTEVWAQDQVAVADGDLIAIDAQDNTLAVLTAPAGATAATVALSALSQTAVWTDGTDRRTLSFDFSPLRFPPFLQVGEGFVALSAQDPGAISTQVELLAWDLDHHFLDTAALSQRVELPPAEAIASAAPMIGSSALVVVGLTAFRFDGQSWRSSDALLDFYRSTVGEGSVQVAAGADVVLLTAPQLATDQKLTALAFDPTRPSAPWQLTTFGPGSAAFEDLAPQFNGPDYLSFGPYFYERATATNWSERLASPLFTLDDLAVDGLVLNQAPALVLYDTETPKGTAAAFQVKNQERQPNADIAGQTFQLSRSNAPGSLPLGPSSFFTFPAGFGNLDAASSIQLHRAVGDGLASPLKAFPAVQVDRDNGFGQIYSSSIEYDALAATADPTGTYARFYRVAASASVGDNFGLAGTELSTFVNGSDPATESSANYFSLDGSPLGRTELRGPLGATLARADAIEAGPNGEAVAPGLARALEAMGLACPAGTALQFAADLSIWTPAVAGTPSFTVFPRGGASSGRVSVVSGMPASSSSSTYQVFTQRAFPQGASAEPFPIYGSYSRVIRRTSSSEGLERVLSVDFLPDGAPAPLDGYPVRQLESTTNIFGERESHATAFTYASEVYPQLGPLAANVLGQAARTLVSVAVDGRTAVTCEGSGQTWAAFEGAAGPVWDRCQQLAWRGGQVAPGVPADDPSAWLAVQTVVGRSPAGAITESLDALGLPTTYLRATDGRLLVGEFRNARASGEEVGYFGFENYEAPGPWKVQSATPRAYAPVSLTGFQSLALGNAAATGLTASFQPNRQDQVYVLVAWYTTSFDFAPEATAGLAIHVVDSAGASHPISGLAFRRSPTSWTTASTPIDLPALAEAGLSGPFRIFIAGAGSSQGSVFLDGIRFSPRACQARVTAIDSTRSVVAGTLTEGTAFSRIFLDRFDRPFVSVGPDGVLGSVAMEFLSRSLSQVASGPFGDGFDADHPNLQATLRCLGASSFESFRDGDGWSSRWGATAELKNWTLSAGTLTNTSGRELVLRPSTGALAPGTLIGFDVLAVPLEAGFSLRMGGKIDLTFSPGAGWSLELDGAAVPASRTTGALGTLVVYLQDTTILIFAAGCLLFSGKVREAVTGPIELALDSEVSIRSLFRGTGPSLALVYRDANNTVRQGQTVGSNDAILLQEIRDDLGRHIATTKPVPSSFLPAGSPLGAYQARLVDVPSFLVSLATGDARMTGPVADFYDGSGYASDDGGFPYVRSVYERRPHARVVQSGAAGALLAIAPDNRPVTWRFAYCPNGGADDAVSSRIGLPAGAFLLAHTTSPTGAVQLDFQDTLGRPVARFAVLGDGSLVGTTSFVRYGMGSARVITNLPLSFGAASDAPDFRQESRFDALARKVSVETPNGGSTSFLYDDAGNLRFIQDAADAATVDAQGRSRARFQIHDRLHRPLVSGILFADWKTLAARANDSSWPAEDQCTVLARHHFDGDGGDPRALGRLDHTSAGNPASASGAFGPASVDLALRYDALGRTRMVTTSVHGDTAMSGNDAISTYEYDGASNVHRQTVQNPPGGTTRTLLDLIYRYDGLERLVEVRNGSDPLAPPLMATDFQSNGQPRCLTQANAVVRRDVFDSNNRVTGATFTPLSGGAPYWTLALERDAEGRIVAESATFGTVDGVDLATLSYADRYDFDGASRLTGLAGDPARAAAFGYDADGNLETAGRSTFLRVAGSDRLQEAALPEGIAAFSYDPTGRISRRIGPAAATFDNGSTPARPPRSLTIGDTETAFLYDSFGRRVVKETRRQGTTIRADMAIFGGSDLRSVLVDRSGQTTSFVFVDQAPAILASGGRTYAAITDTRASTRLLVAAGAEGSTLGAAFSDLPFGQVWRSQVGELAPGLGRFYAGQPFDVETGLYAFKARYYDPSIARFLACDPCASVLSPYAYVDGDPIDRIDPDGQKWWVAALLVGAGVVIGLATDGVGDALYGALVGADEAEAAAAGAEAAGAGAENAEAGANAVRAGDALRGNLGRAAGNAARASLRARAAGPARFTVKTLMKGLASGLQQAGLNDAETGQFSADEFAVGAITGAFTFAVDLRISTALSRALSDGSAARWGFARSIIGSMMEGAVTNAGVAILDAEVENNVFHRKIDIERAALNAFVVGAFQGLSKIVKPVIWQKLRPIASRVLSRRPVPAPLLGARRQTNIELRRF